MPIPAPPTKPSTLKRSSAPSRNLSARANSDPRRDTTVSAMGRLRLAPDQRLAWVRLTSQPPRGQRSRLHRLLQATATRSSQGPRVREFPMILTRIADTESAQFGHKPERPDGAPPRAPADSARAQRPSGEERYPPGRRLREPAGRGLDHEPSVPCQAPATPPAPDAPSHYRFRLPPAVEPRRTALLPSMSNSVARRSRRAAPDAAASGRESSRHRCHSVAQCDASARARFAPRNLTSGPDCSCAGEPDKADDS
jgi:hypothetical protein